MDGVVEFEVAHGRRRVVGDRGFGGGIGWEMRDLKEGCFWVLSVVNLTRFEEREEREDEWLW